MPPVTEVFCAARILCPTGGPRSGPLPASRGSGGSSRLLAGSAAAVAASLAPGSIETMVKTGETPLPVEPDWVYQAQDATAREKAREAASRDLQPD